MDHRGAPGSGNDGCWALPPFHERAPLASPRGLLDGRRLRCLRLKSSSPCHVVGNSAITPVKREKGPHARQQRTGQKQELTIKLCPAQSSAPLTTRSHPYGSHKCTRSARLEQSVSLSATRRPSTVSLLWARSE